MENENNKSVHLVEDIIEEILSRLPLKSLVRFRCVSKSWLSLISSERFIEAHFQNRVMFECRNGDVYMQCSVRQWLNEASSVEPTSIYDPANNNQFLREAEIVGSCNGLLCVINYQRDCLLLWNPTTMIFMELPNLNGLRFDKIGFGWDGTSGAYKVFASSATNGSVGNVYSSKTNSWKTVEFGCHAYDINGVFACGKIHWLTNCRDYYIESFDLESEVYERIELPPLPTGFSHPVFGHPSYTFVEICGCFHLVCLLRFHDQQLYAVVWVMKEESRWLKLFSHPLVIGRVVLSTPAILAGGLNGEILVIFYDNYLVYSPKQDVVVREGMHKFKCCKGLVYVESLVSPNFTTPS